MTRQRCPSCGEWFMGPEAVGDPCFPCQGLYIPDSQEINKEIVQKVIRIGNSNFDWNKKESK